jgi:hypothetical protein
MKEQQTIAVSSLIPHPSSLPQDSPFFVPPFLDLLGGLVHRFQNLFLGLGRLETSLLAGQLTAIAVSKPVYVCGLARSGTTLLHRIVASPAGVATHRVKDYPMVYTPYWWRQATARLRPTAPRERVHRDRVLISPDSPEAVEEMLWMAFFPHCHDPSVDNRLAAASSHAAFEAFYRAHISKLLLAERATRYVAKANYHVARLAYLVRLFPDARIVLAVRDPVSHIASLVRQHRWFCRGQRQHPPALRWMQRLGHFEFGRDRRPINLGDCERVRMIRSAWTAGDEVRGWAHYWDMVYGYVARLLDTDVRVRAATKIVHFDDMCAAPAETIRAVLQHCALPDRERVVAEHAPSIRAPDYYESPLSAAEEALVREITASTTNAMQGLRSA